jgi:hypothetical protein
MTDIQRRALLLSLGGLLLATAAMATPPSPGNSTVPPCISLVGSKNGVPDPSGTFTVTVRDLANNPQSGATVTIDLQGCTDLKLCADQLDPNATLLCDATHTQVSKLTNALGQATFIVLGVSNGYTGGANPHTNATTLLGGGRIFANLMLIGSPTVSCYDLDGSQGVGIGDLTAWLIDFGTFNAPPFGRSDYDCSGNVGINDLSLWLTEFGAATSPLPTQPVCP